MPIYFCFFFVDFMKLLKDVVKLHQVAFINGLTIKTS